MTNPRPPNGRTNRQRITEKIKRLDGMHEPAAPRKRVIEYARHKLSIENPEAFVDRLERDGTIYEPRPGFVRVTDR